jgi:hypothetical protein
MITYPLFGLLTVILICLAGLYLVQHWPGTHDMSLSLHAAAKRESYWYFGVSLTVLGAMLSIFVFIWLIPTFSLGAGFSITYVLTFLTQLISAWVPDTAGLQRRIHRSAAYFMAIMFFLITVQLAASPLVSLSARIFCAFMAAYMAISFVAVIKLPALRKHYLIYQSAFVGCLGLSILAVTFWR